MKTLTTLLTLALFCGAALAATLVPPPAIVIPDHATALFARYSARLTPSGRDWTAAERQYLRAGSRTAAQLDSDAAAACLSGAFATCRGKDPDGLALVALMEAMSDASDNFMQAYSKMRTSSKVVSAQATKTVSAQHLNSDQALIAGLIHDAGAVKNDDPEGVASLVVAADHFSELLVDLSNTLKKLDTTKNHK
jgi:hypothetical protein